MTSHPFARAEGLIMDAAREIERGSEAVPEPVRVQARLVSVQLRRIAGLLRKIQGLLSARNRLLQAPDRDGDAGASEFN